MVQERAGPTVASLAPAAGHPYGVGDRDAGGDHPEERANSRVLREADTEPEEEDDSGHDEDQDVKHQPHEPHTGTPSMGPRDIEEGQVTPAETMYCIAWAELQSTTLMSSRGSWTSQPDWGMGVEGM